MDPERHELSTDAALRLLADRRRRQTLGFLIEHDDGVTAVDELAATIVSGTADGSGDGERDRGGDEDVTLSGIVVELRHVHLPKLDERGVVDYDPRSDIVQYRPHDRLEDLYAFVSETFDDE